MGWKSTIDIKRRDAINAIISTIDKTPYDEMSNEELETLMYNLGIGDEAGKPYYGHNFNVHNDEDEIDN